ncbi:MAG: hypothetical protein K0U93_19835 [Gammaproteobacteria bacterium]|nr:hypothetical protein [Gammaproteobacteria bacterium]
MGTRLLGSFTIPFRGQGRVEQGERERKRHESHAAADDGLEPHGKLAFVKKKMRLTTYVNEKLRDGRQSLAAPDSMPDLADSGPI